MSDSLETSESEARPWNGATRRAPREEDTQPLTELLAAADDVCKTLEHPTQSVNASQMWRLRDALTAHGVKKDQAS